jgi:hypothetical protein
MRVLFHKAEEEHALELIRTADLVNFELEQLGQSGQARKIRWPRCSKCSAETRNSRTKVSLRLAVQIGP